MYNNTLELSNKNEFLRKVFFQMVLGLIVTSGVAVGVLSNHTFLQAVAGSYNFIIVLQLVVVLALNFGINKIGNGTAKLLFFLYSGMTGLTMSIIMLIYDPLSVMYVLGVTTIIFVVMAIYGLTTSEDLMAYSKFFRGGLITLVIVSLVNLFLKVSFLYWATSVFAVVLFTGLIAYDVNRIARVFERNNLSDEELSKFSTIGALMLYLDFINLFLNLLRLFGKRR